MYNIEYFAENRDLLYGHGKNSECLKTLILRHEPLLEGILEQLVCFLSFTPSLTCF